MPSGKIVVKKVLKCTRTASAKLKIPVIRKISTKNRKKFNNFIPKYAIYKF